jgi:hypothetical protein
MSLLDVGYSIAGWMEQTIPLSHGTAMACVSRPPQEPVTSFRKPVKRCQDLASASVR